MSRLSHHLSQVGDLWCAAFALLVAVAVVGAIVAVVVRERDRAFGALIVSGGATVAVVITTAAVAAFGIASAQSAPADPFQAARVMAEGLSLAMNGAAMGFVATLVAGASVAVCLIALSTKPKTREPRA